MGRHFTSTTSASFRAAVAPTMGKIIMHNSGFISTSYIGQLPDFIGHLNNINNFFYPPYIKSGAFAYRGDPKNA